MTTLLFGRTPVGDGMPVLLVAEIGLNHNGSLSLAHRMIDVAAESGATMVKFQKREPDALASEAFLDLPFTHAPGLGHQQRMVRQRLELSPPALKDLKNHAEDLGMLFSMSVFDLPSLMAAVELDLPVIKIASHSVTNRRLLEAIRATGRPAVMSLGAASWEERDRAVEIMGNMHLVLLHCVSSYPCPDKLVHLDTIREIRKRYGKLVGYSGHEGGTDLALAAIVLGACVVEKHFTLNRAMSGLDHAISLEPNEFARLALAARRVEQARGVSPGLLPGESRARENYHVAVCAAVPIPNGTRIRAEHLVLKQPLGAPGINFTGLEEHLVLGKMALQDLPVDTPIPRSAVGDA